MRRLGVQGLIFFYLVNLRSCTTPSLDCRIPFFRAVYCVATHCLRLLLSQSPEKDEPPPRARPTVPARPKELEFVCRAGKICKRSRQSAPRRTRDVMRVNRRPSAHSRVDHEREPQLASAVQLRISVVRYRGSNTSQISARVLLASSRQVGAGLAGTGRTDVNTAMFTSAHHSGISRPALPLLRCRCVVAPHGADYLKNTARVFVIIHELYIFAPHSRHGDVCRGHNVTPPPLPAAYSGRAKRRRCRASSRSQSSV
ncbi:unnamed protein product [Trichogramma brassicae]|uniref:Secreted protein n=1 Tax=Trichogramma brassicae TaxID=86971 RepID=A0A6H5IW77_9HYME|nr:unnamed protein product [Trichogramma brassicae]